AAETSFLNALRTLEPNDHRGRAETLTALGNVYANEDELSKAEKVYTEALTIYKRLADERQIALLLRHVAAMYSLERRDDDALRLLQQALKLTKTNHDADIEVEVLNILGVVYYRQGKNGKAAGAFNQALGIASDTGVRVDLGELLNNLGNAYEADHKYKD